MAILVFMFVISLEEEKTWGGYYFGCINVFLADQ